MLTTIREMPLRALVAAQAAPSRAVEKLPSSRRGRLEVAGGALMGVFLAGESTALAAGQIGKTTQFIGNVSGVILLLIGALFVAYGLYGAVTWTTAGGNSGKVNQAKDTIKNALIGVGIAGLLFVARGIVVELVTKVGGNPGSAAKGTGPGGLK